MSYNQKRLAFITFGVTVVHALIAGALIQLYDPFTFQKLPEKFVVKFFEKKQVALVEEVHAEIVEETPLEQDLSPLPKEEIIEDKITLEVPPPIPVEEKKVIKKQRQIPVEAKKVPPKNPPKPKVSPTVKQKPDQKPSPITTKKPEPPQKNVKKEIAKEEKKTVELTQREKILQKAKENVAKLQKTRDNLKPAKKPVSPELEDVGFIKSLSIDNKESVSAAETGYYGALTGRLRQTLRLPEYGDVKVMLTLDREGKVISIETAPSKSENNRKYVEATLNKVQFPPFGKNFQGENKRTFSIKLATDK
jgi:hypothetical protein